MANDEAFFHQYAGNPISVAFQIYLIRLEQGYYGGYESEESDDALPAVACQWPLDRLSSAATICLLLFLLVQMLLLITRKCHTNLVNIPIELLK